MAPMTQAGLGMVRVAVAAMGLAAMMAAANMATARSALSPADAQRRYEETQRNLQRSKAREKALARDLAIMERERAQLRKHLIDTSARIQRTEARLTEIEGKLARLSVREKTIRAKLAKQHGKIVKLLAAMQRMGRNPPPVMITRRRDALAMVRSAMLLASVFPGLKDKALALSSDLERLVTVMTAQRKEKARLEAENKRLAEDRARLDRLLAERKARLAERRAELEEVRRMARVYARSAANLGELLEKMDKAVAQKTGLGAYEKELARQREAERRATRPAPAPGGAPPPAAPAPGARPGEKQVALLPPPIELRPTPGTKPLSPGRLKPAIPFHKAKGRLPLPVRGRRILGFGDKTRYGDRSKGIAIETRPGAQVVSPADGWIVYADHFRTLGRVLIINAGGGYHIMLAGMGRFDVNPGQFVVAGEPLGRMNTTLPTSQNGTKKLAPLLYIEFRKNKRAVDPSPWWRTDVTGVPGFAPLGRGRRAG